MVLHTVIGRAGIAGTLDYALSIPAKQALPPNPPAATTAWHARSTDPPQADRSHREPTHLRQAWLHCLSLWAHGYALVVVVPNSQ